MTGRLPLGGRCSDAQPGRLPVVQPRPVPTGVCIVRIEPHGQGLRLTVTVNPDIAQRSTEKRCSFIEIGDALAAVEKFLIEYARQQRL
ncbi:MAG: hypothetical protein LC749_20320 [Actinobacteria bacterium]|nr:hypothetical protein [Actinomycetota bacterium]